jgi:hypothetical protein
MTTMDQTMKDQLKKDYPHFQWDRLEEINRALNWELHFGPLEPGYWVAIEPLDHYEWHGGAQALTDIQEMMNNLPVTLFYDLDFGEFAGETHPYNEDHNWEEIDDELTYIGPQEYLEVVVLDLVLYKEVRRLL